LFVFKERWFPEAAWISTGSVTSVLVLGNKNNSQWTTEQSGATGWHGACKLFLQKLFFSS